MNILFNFSPIKIGGGQNVAMNFLFKYFEMETSGLNSFFFVAKDSEPHRFLVEKRCKNFLVLPRNPIKRILFEVFKSRKYLKDNKIDIIYSYFGVGLFFSDVPQVSGSADSNLYFPEIDFWSDFKGIKRLKKYLIDQYRIFGVKRSTAVVFENAALEERARQLYKLKNSRVIKPSINFNFESQELCPNGGKKFFSPSGLFLCGWHPNKNYQIIPSLAANLNERGQRFCFVLTAPLDSSPEHNAFVESVKEYGVEDLVFLIGQVGKDQLKSLYENIDFVFLLSKLESFSNNIIESWYFNKPLVVADEVWSKSICGNAAIYVNRDSVDDISDMIVNSLCDVDYLNSVIEAGRVQLEGYPSIDERICQEIEYLREIYEYN